MLNMCHSWVKRNSTTQVMYIAKLKNDPKRVKKTFLMVLEMVFKMVWWRGRKSHKKDFWSWNVFLLSEYWLPLYLKRLLDLFFFFFLVLFLFFSMPRLLRTWGVWMIFEQKDHFFKKFLFKWLDMEWHGHDCGDTNGGRIFRNGVMHANIAKPWIWRYVVGFIAHV
jgi:hypothetical protein